MDICVHHIFTNPLTIKVESDCSTDLLKQILANQKTIMANQADLIAAAEALSTASDAVSVKLDTLITKVDAVVAALSNVDLPPEGAKALADLQASAANAATAGDKVDAEVAKLDTVLPTPAPAAPVS